MEAIARQVAAAESASRLEAREAVQAAADVLEWRYDFPPAPWRVERLARLMIQYERARLAASKPQLEMLG